MKRMGSLALAAPLLLLASCQQAPDATPGNKAAAAKPGTGTTKLPDDAALRKALIGAWVISDKRPEGDRDDYCATDNGIFLDADGSYAEFSEAGRWVVKNGLLLIVTTKSLPDFDEENQSEKPLETPRIMKWTVLEVDRDLAQVRTETGPAWLIRCPALAKA